MLEQLTPEANAETVRSKGSGFPSKTLLEFMKGREIIPDADTYPVNLTHWREVA